MPIQRTLLAAFMMMNLFLCACANMPRQDPVQVYVVGIEPLQGQGLELRMMVKLRVQNPNDAPIEYRGVSIGMDLQGRSFASGVSDASGNVPRFGETVIEVPVSVSAFRMVHRAMDVFGLEPGGKIEYELKGKLAGSLFRSVRFTAKGEMALPERVHAIERDAGL